MKKICSFTGIAFFFLLALSPLAFKKMDQERINTAISKSLSLLQKNNTGLLHDDQTGQSYIPQTLRIVDFALAKEKGFDIPDSAFGVAPESISNTQHIINPASGGNENPETGVLSGIHDLWAFSANHISANKSTGILATTILQNQNANGSWSVRDSGSSFQSESFYATALAIRGIQNYIPPGLQPVARKKLTLAKFWLMNAMPQNNEEYNYQLLGLSWSEAEPAIIKQKSKLLLSLQNADGGWSGQVSFHSDAFATGQSLYALNQSGSIGVYDSTYLKGIEFLLKTQQENGSWQEQNGTNWATMALLLAVK